MPELPEVENVRQVLNTWVKGRKIVDITSNYPSIISNATLDDFKSKLIGHTINTVDRYGKFLIFRLDDLVLLSHLRMSGKYYKRNLDDVDDASFTKHIHLSFKLDDNSLLHYHDVRKFGRFYLTDSEHYKLDPSPLSKLGKEPFNQTSDLLYIPSRKSKLTVKELLLDQTIIVGLGNIYVDETCFSANVYPLRRANTLTRDECDRLVSSAIKILNKAITMGGSTVHDFSFANGATGMFQNELKVYGREGERCPNCGTPITKTRVGGRGTCFCSLCQPNIIDKKVRVIGLTGLIGSGKSTTSLELIKHGYNLVDTDVLSRHSLDKDGVCYKKTVQEFGKRILNEDKTINRSVLRDIVTNDKDSLARLNNIIHPYIYEECAKSIKDKSKKYLLDVPLLFETGIDKLCDITIFINTKDSVRHKRLIERATMPIAQTAKLNGKASDAYAKIAKSTVIIDNSLDEDTTRMQIKALIERIK